ncbi:aminotransferase class IV [Desulfurobacterium atlanticum]|uniref:branched-chain-amino-acid transaminase n=1 Tax=Desulfurobacterium atlanticum TaxID=240169 RepID=A0A238Y1A9_9BACT|nr:aminotransferase class IV [Desulfurobacterium atlanticum]SNR65086.1 branched-chain amino acid aminotransferase/4-amino-4-deoxychorismate lyase [Desulfurobacterium atlanticum]
MEKFGIFETVRVENGKAVFISYHYERLRKSAVSLDIPFSISLEKFNSVVEKECGDGLNLVKFVLYHDGNFTVSTRECFVPKEVSLTFDFSVRRKKDFLSDFKTLSIYDSLYALLKAKNKGFDEVVLLDTSGFVSETAFANIFFLKNGVVFTPSLETGCLPGTRREIVIEILKEMGVPVIEGFFKPEFLLSAEEAFITSARYDVVRVSYIDGKKFKVEGISFTDRVKKVIERLKFLK